MRAEVEVLALEVLGGVVVLLGLALVLARNLPVLDDEDEDVADNGLPANRLLRSDDIARLRFRIGLRGYRMSDVDAALDAVQRSLAAAEGADANPDGALDGGPAQDAATPVAEQPPTAAERPLSELEQLHGRDDT